MYIFRVRFLQEMNKENTQKKAQGGQFYQLQRYQDDVIYFGRQTHLVHPKKMPPEKPRIPSVFLVF